MIGKGYPKRPFFGLNKSPKLEPVYKLFDAVQNSISKLFLQNKMDVYFFQDDINNLSFFEITKVMFIVYRLKLCSQLIPFCAFNKDKTLT